MRGSLRNTKNYKVNLHKKSKKRISDKGVEKRIILFLSTEKWKNKCDKMDLFTELSTLSTKNRVNKLVYIGFQNKQVFCGL